MLQRIAILVSDGFTDSALSVALDVFRAANSLRVRAGAKPTFRVVVAPARGGVGVGARWCGARGLRHGARAHGAGGEGSSSRRRRSRHVTVGRDRRGDG